MNTLDLTTLTLAHGAHRSRDNGVCAMEAVAWLAGEPHSDAPACACPVLRRYVIAMNDSLPDDQRQRLVAYIPRLVGTAETSTIEVKRRRAFVAADWAVRVFAVSALRSAGMVCSGCLTHSWR